MCREALASAALELNNAKHNMPGARMNVLAITFLADSVGAGSKYNRSSFAETSLR